MRGRGWDTIWTGELTCHLKDKQLIHGQIGPTMRVNCTQHHLKYSEGFSPSQNVFYYHLPAFWWRNHELTIKDYLQLLLHCHENTPCQPKFGQKHEKCCATRKECHVNKALSKTQTQCRHLPWPAHVQKRHTELDRNLPPCSRTMVNATNANIVMGQRYRRLTRHQRTPKHSRP